MTLLWLPMLVGYGIIMLVIFGKLPLYPWAPIALALVFGPAAWSYR